MSAPSIKQFIIGAVATITIAMQLVSPALAATDQAVAQAAQAGMEYLAQHQNNDGNIAGLGGETEWSVIAVTANGQDPATFRQEQGASATQFLENNPLPATASATDLERKILAIAATNQNPKIFGGVDHIARLQSQHNNAQLGDPILLNDDIFGVIAIAAAQDTTLQSIAQDALHYFLAHQQADGGFSYTTETCVFCGADSNDTAAAIIAMYAAERLGLTHSDLVAKKDKAALYLLSTQQMDGGFGYDAFSPSDGSSTAWSLMALNVIGSSQTQAQAARDWLLANQNADGGFSYGAFGFTESSTSITAHAILALLGTSWLLHPEPIRAAPNSVSTSPQIGTAAQTLRGQALAPATAFTTAAQHSPQQAQTTGGSETATQAQPQTKAAQTKPLNQPPSQADSEPNYALYGLPVLIGAALGWFVLQSRNKQEI